MRPCATSSQSDISPSGSQEEAGQDTASESDQELPSLLDEPMASEMHAGYIKDLQAVEMRIMVKLEMIRTEFKTVLNQVLEAIEARQPKESESLGQLEMLQNPAETNEELKDICETQRLPLSKENDPIPDPLLWPGPGLRNQTNDEKNWNRGAVDRLLLEGQEGEEGL